MVCVDGLKSESFRSTEGVKQGCILSPFLFNFFNNDLLIEVCELGIGAIIGENNVSILAYCDDLLLLSTNESQRNQLLECCYKYSITWKM